MNNPTMSDAVAVFTAWRDLQQDGHLVPDQSARIVTAESATRIRIFNTSLVPGVLQSRGWAMAMAEPSVALGLAGAPLDGRAAAEKRLERQRILTDPGREIHILMTLTPLRRSKPPQVFAEQIEHLMRATEATTFRFGIVPDFADVTADVTADFDLYDLPGGPLVEIGTVAGEVRSTHPEDAALCERIFNAFAATACYGQAARDQLATVAAEAAAAGRAAAVAPLSIEES